MTDKPVVTAKLDLKWTLNEDHIRFLMQGSQLRFVMHLESKCEELIRKQIRTQLRAIYVANGGSLDNRCFEVFSEPGEEAPIHKFGGA